jgi:hypothetical protein
VIVVHSSGLGSKLDEVVGGDTRLTGLGLDLGNGHGNSNVNVNGTGA